MKYFRLCLFSVLMAVGIIVQAATPKVTATWTIPTTRADGSVLPVAELAGYELYYTVDKPMDAQAITVPVSPGSVNTKTFDMTLAPKEGDYTIYMAIAAVDTMGRKSALSNIVSLKMNVPVASPSAPQTFKITINCPNGGCTYTIQ